MTGSNFGMQVPFISIWSPFRVSCEAVQLLVVTPLQGAGHAVLHIHCMCGGRGRGEPEVCVSGGGGHSNKFLYTSRDLRYMRTRQRRACRILALASGPRPRAPAPGPPCDPDPRRPRRRHRHRAAPSRVRAPSLCVCVFDSTRLAASTSGSSAILECRSISPSPSQQLSSPAAQQAQHAPRLPNADAVDGLCKLLFRSVK